MTTPVISPAIIPVIRPVIFPEINPVIARRVHLCQELAEEFEVRRNTSNASKAVSTYAVSYIFIDLVTDF